MAIRLDPQNQETAVLLHFIGELTGQQVLEIGCGNGRLTWRYAHLAKSVEAIDPHSQRITEAQKTMPPLKGRVSFRAVSLENYEAVGLFDLVLLSWALC